MIADDIIMKTEAEKVNVDQEDDKRVHTKMNLNIWHLICSMLLQMVF